MSTQTVVDVVVSGTTTTVVDKRIDGITTVAGAPPITNVSGQIPDLGVKTCLLGTEGDILSLTNDIANLRANLIVTGTTLTDEIGVLSGHLISTGNNLEFQISTLSGNLIASGNNLDYLRDVLSGNLITTGNTLQALITGATGDISTLTQNLISTGNNLESQIAQSNTNISTLSGAVITTGTTLTSAIISTGNRLDGERDILSGNLITTGQTLYALHTGLDKEIQDVGNNLIDTGNNLEPRINTNVTNISTLNTATGVLSSATGELQEYKFGKEGGTISGTLLPSSSGSLNIGSPSLYWNSGFFNDLKVSSNTLFIGEVPIKSSEGGINFTSATGTTVFRDVSIRNLTVTGTETVIDVEHLAVKDNIIIINSGESGAGIGVRSGGLVIDRGTLPDADFLFNENNDRFELNFPVAVDGNVVVTQNQTGAYADASNLIQTGATLQNQITSNDSDITDLETATGELKTQSNTTDTNLITTGQFLTSEIATVSGIAGGSSFDELSGNLITTGETLTSEISIVSGLIGQEGTDIDTLSGHLITTGQTLQTQITANDSDISTLTSNLITTGSRIDEVSGNLIATGTNLQSQISSNDTDISNLVADLRQTGVNMQNILRDTGVGIDDISGNVDTLSANVITTGQTLTSEINIVSGIASAKTDVTALSGMVIDISGNLITTGSYTDILSGSLISTGNNLQNQISSNDTQIAGIIGDLVTTGQTLTNSIDNVSDRLADTGILIDILSGNVISTGEVVDDISGNLIATGRKLTSDIASTASTASSNLVNTGNFLDSEIAIVSGLTTGSSSDPALSGKVDTLSGNLISTGSFLTSEIGVVSGIAGGQDLTNLSGTVDTLSGNVITTGQYLTDEIAIVSGLAGGGDIDTLSGNLITTGQTLTTNINTVSGNLVATGKTLTDNVNTVSSNLVSTGKVVDDISGNLITTGQTLQTQITSNDTDITNLTSNLITTGQTLTAEVTTVSGLITDNDADITALKSATGVLKTSTDNNTANLITTGSVIDDVSGNLITTGQTLQTQITSNDSDISTLTSNLVTTGQTLTSEIAIVSGIATGGSAEQFNELSGNLITTGQTLTNKIISTGNFLDSETAIVSGLTTTNSSNLISTGKVVDSISGNLITTGQTLQTQISSNDTDISALTANLTITGAVTDNVSGNLITTGQTLTTEIATVSGLITDNDGDITALKNATGVLKTSTDNNTANLISTGVIIDDISGNLITSGQTLTSEIGIVSGLTVTNSNNLISTGKVADDISGNLISTGQTLQTQITSNDGDITTLTSNLISTGNTLDTTTVKLTTNQSIAGDKIFTDKVTINNLTVTGTEVIVDVENLAVKDNIIEINSGEAGAGISRISGGIVIDRGSLPNANILYNDANDRFELNFPLAVEGKLVANNPDLISTGAIVDNISGNLITTGQTLTTNLVSTGNFLDSEIATVSGMTTGGVSVDTLSGHLITTGQTLQTQITSNDGDISTLTTNLVSTGAVVDDISGNLITTGQTLQTQITSNDTDITNLSSNLVTTGQTLTTNINTVANNLVTTGQTLTSEIATVSGLIPATVIDGGGTANTVPLWSDANTIGDSVISQSGSKIGIGTATPGATLHVRSADELNATFESSDSGSRILVKDDDTNTYINAADNVASIGQNVGLNPSNLNILSNGSVGIGTISPGAKLQIMGGTSGFDQISLSSNVTADTTKYAGVIMTNYANTTTLLLGAKAEDGTTSIFYGSSGSDHRGPQNHIFYTNASSTATSGNTERMRITSAGSVGIGTNAPDGILHVANTTYIDAPTNTGNSSALIWRRLDKTIVGRIVSDTTNLRTQFWDNNSSVLTISNDKVGIGSENPAYKLDVRGDYIFVDDGKGIRIGGSSHQVTRETSNELRLKSANTSGFTTFYTGSDTEKMRIAADGKVGIGTNAPASLLHVFSASSSQTYSTGADELIVEGSDHAGISILAPAAKRAQLYLNTDAFLRWVDSDGVFTIETSSSSSKIAIAPGGSSVGIGTNAPVAKLHVAASSDDGIRINSNNAIIGQKSSHATHGTQLLFWDGTDAYLGRSIAGLGNGTVTSWNIRTGGVNKVVINSTGVGIGTDAPNEALEVNGIIRIFDSSASKGNISALNTSDQGVPMEIRAEYIALRPSASSPSTSHPEAMRIATGGNVGIGTDTPATLLDVTGGSGAYGLRLGPQSDATTFSGRLYLAGSSGTNAVLRYGSYLAFTTGATAGSASGTVRMVVLDGGNVGINVANPSARLQVNQAASDQSGAAALKVVGTAYGTNKAIYSYMGTTSNAKSLLYVENSNGVLLNIAGDGEIRVANQTLVDSANTNYKMTFPDNSGIAMGSAYTFANIYGSSGNLYLRANAYPANTGSDSKIYLQTASGSGGQASDVVVNNGNVGIGTDAPEAALTVADSTLHQAIFRTAQATASERAGGGFSSLGHATATSRYARLFLDADGANFSGTDYFTIEKFGNSGEVKLLQYSNANMSFWVNTSTQAMTIKNDGAVGVGTATPNAGSWSNAVTIQGASSVGLELMKGSSLYAFMGVQGSGSSHALDIAAYQNQSIRLRVGSNAGTTAVTILNDGKVGIGTVTPSSELHIASSDNRPTIRLQGNKTSDGNFADIYATNDGSNGEAQISFRRVGANDAVDMLFYTSATGSAMAERMRIASTGAITFNTAFTFPTADGSAGQVLQTNGSGTVTWATVTGGGGISGSGTDNYVPRWNGTTALQNSSIYAKDDGNIGIGTATPAQKLHVNGLTKLGTYGKTEGGAVIEYAAFGEIKGGAQTMIGNAVVPGTANNTIQHSKSDAGNYIRMVYSEGIAFHTNITNTVNTDVAVGSSNERMRINLAGNVGIGTAAPRGTLDIEGANKDIRLYGDANSYIRIYHNGTDGYFESTASTGSNYGLITRAKDYEFQTWDSSWSTKMFIKTDGNVGIGTNAPAYALDVRSSGATTLQVKSANNSDDTQLRLQSNAFFFNITNEGASGNITYISDDAQDQIWYTDNASNSSVERFRIKGGANTSDVVFSNSNVGIGVTPAATLHVQASSPEFRLATASSAVVRLRTSGDNYINTGQNLGIGTNNPDYRLTVDAGTTNEIARFRSTDNDALISISDNTDTVYVGLDASADIMSLGFSNSFASTNLSIDTVGNIGIGTNASGAKLHVRGSDGYLKFDTSGSDGTIKSDYNLKLYADDTGDNSSGYQNIQFYTAGANERMRISHDGKVAIGTIVNTYKFEVVTGSSAGVFEYDTVANGTQTIKFEPSSTKAGGTSKIYSSYAGTGATEGKLALGTYSAQTAIIMDSGGRVGINVASPSNRFEVAGTSKFTGNVNIGAAGAGYDALFQSTTSGQYWEWDASMSLTRYRDNTKAVFGNGDDLQLYHDGSNSYLKNKIGWLNVPLSQNGMSLANADFSELIATFKVNSSCDLYYDGSKKFETTSTGVSITGDTVSTSKVEADSWVRSKSQLRVSADYSVLYYYKTDNSTMLGYLLMRDNGVNYLSWASGQDFGILEGNTRRLTIKTSTGSVGIGTDAPTKLLDVNGTTYLRDDVFFGNTVLNIASGFSNQTGMGWDKSAGQLQIAGNQTAALELGRHTSAGTVLSVRYASSQVATIESGGQIRSLSGAVTAPSFSFTNDTTTGMSRPTTSALNFITNATERVRIDATGNVGIGITPTTKLHVSYPAVGQDGSAVTALTTTTALNLGLKLGFTGGANSNNNIIGGISLGNSGEEFAGMYALDGGSSAATDLAFFVGTTSGITEAVKIDSSGSVGIGTNAPSAKLYVNGTTYINNSLTVNSSINFEQYGQYLTFYGGGEYEHSISSRNSSGNAADDLRINTFGALFINLDSNNNNTSGADFSIGRHGQTGAITDWLLDLSGETGKLQLNKYGSGTHTGTLAKSLGVDSSGNVIEFTGGTGTVTGSGTDHYVPRWNGTTALQDSAIISLDSGSVGIGTNAPGAPLQVNHSGGADADILILHNNRNTLSDKSGIRFQDTFRVRARIQAINASTGNAGAHLAFETGYATDTLERMRLNNMGNLGIGTDNPTAKLHVYGGNIRIASTDDKPQLEFVETSTARWVIGNSNAPNNYFAISEGNDIATFEYITIAPTTGCVGIGTVAPCRKLHVWGTGDQTDETNGTFWFGDNTTGAMGLFGGVNNANDYAFIGSVRASQAYEPLILNPHGGEIGIHNTTPQYSLDVYQGAYNEFAASFGMTLQTSSSNNWGGIHFGYLEKGNKNYRKSALVFERQDGAARGKIHLLNNSQDGSNSATIADSRMTIQYDGNVGIGTTAPAAHLHVSKASGATTVLTQVAANSTVGLEIKKTGSTTQHWKIVDGETVNGTLEFYDATNSATRMAIKGDGNVGIGTAAPLDKLDVYGTGAIFRNLSDNADSVQIVRGTNHNASPDAKFYIFDDSSADWAAKINLGGASYGLDIIDGADYFLLCRKPSNQRIFEIHGSSTVVNDAGIDYDFRVESDNDDYLLFTEGSTDRVAISTNTPAAKLHVEGDLKVGTTDNGNWMGYKNVTLNGTTYATVLTINLSNHRGCYVKLFLTGDWSSHSAVAFVGEYFVQNGSDGYAEPGTVISEFDNTNTDSIESKIVDPSSDTFTIQLKLSTADNGTLSGKLSYHVMGAATAVS